MGKKVNEYIKEYWLYFIIITQPILDIIAYFSFNEKITPISFTIRSIYLLFIVIYSFLNTKKKKEFLISIAPFIIYSFLHILNSYRLSGINIFGDIRYTILVFQMPIITISLIFYAKENMNQIKRIEKGIFTSFMIIAISIILSIVTNTFDNTYDQIGITGWFSSANTQSMILSSLTAMTIYYLSKKDNYLYFIGLSVIFITLFLNGTRACYYTLISSLMLFFYLLIVNRKGKAKILFTATCLVLTIAFYNISYTSLRSNSVIKEAESNRAIIESENNLETKEAKINILKKSYLYKEMIDVFGEEAVYEEMKDKINDYNLSNNRLVKATYAKIIFKNSDQLTKFLGINHCEIEKYGKDLENDITAIFYYYGYLGFMLYFLFILYFIILGIKLLLKNPLMLLSSKFLTLSYTIALTVLGGEYSGAMLRKPNANIYLAIILVLYYAYVQNKLNNNNIKKNKIKFLLLHLGYGGIESATINTANSLCDKYDIELVSFYNINKNQSHKINRKINIKYLYNGGPNREAFITSYKNHNYLKTIYEGIKAIDILIKKKLFIIKEILYCDSQYIVSTRWDFSILLSKYGKDNNIKIAQEHHYHNNDKKYINILKKYKRIDYLFALTKTLENDYKEFLKNNQHTKVILVPNMLYDLPRKKSSLEEKNIITISRLDKGKRNNEIIEIFSKIKDKDWKLYIIGDGEEYKNLKKQVEELKLEKRVILTGYRTKKEIENYMLKSSIFLMASITEGLPMVLLEAMSYGIPCIAYDIESGVKDIIKDNINGYIIKERNEKEYLNKLETLINDQKLRKKLGENTKETVNKYTKEEITKIWLKILNNN